MQSNFDTCLKEVLKSEGGFVNNPKDPGGMTNLGVTKGAWEAYVGHPVSEGDMRGLTPTIVRPFYKKRYWDVCKCDELPSGLDYIVFDIAVNSGTGRAAKFLQSAVGATPDGVIGNGTLTCVTRTTLSVADLINILCDRRHRFYQSLNGFSTFGAGWLKRTEDVRHRAIQMLAAV